jgi:hypothetical protein
VQIKAFVISFIRYVIPITFQVEFIIFFEVFFLPQDNVIVLIKPNGMPLKSYILNAKEGS